MDVGFQPSLTAPGFPWVTIVDGGVADRFATEDEARSAAPL